MRNDDRQPREIINRMVSTDRLQLVAAGIYSHASLFEFGGYTVRIVSDAAGLQEVYRLRYEVFAEELGWVKDTQAGLDIDRYDCWAVTLGLYDEGGLLIACIRLVARPASFMLEDEFSAVVGKRHAIRTDDDTVEASRFCVKSAARNKTVFVGCRPRNIAILLARGMYQWCQENGIDYVYSVSDEKGKRFFSSLGLPLIRVGGPVRMPDGESCCAFILDWREFERRNAETSPELIEWYSVQVDQAGR